jgi:small subunit ribosomal protein S3
MGQKIHPIGLRVGIIRDWDSRWYARKAQYRDWVLEDARVRRLLRTRFAGDGASRGPRGRNRDAGISRIEIERAPNMLKLTLHTAKPGIIIGRGGRGVEDIRAEIERMVKQKVHINVQEIRQPELDATLVAENIASQIERRVAFKRAVRQTVQRSMKMGAQGIRALISGRLGGAEMSRSYADRDGKIPLHTLRADIDYGFTEARTASGNIGVKVWIYRGDVLPEAPATEQKAERPAAAAERPRRGWRRVGAARRAPAEDTRPAPAREEAAAEKAAVEAAEPVVAVGEAEAGTPEQSEPAGGAGTEAEEQKHDVNAIEGQAPEADEGPQAG